jgi:hypothetical protein
MRSLFADRPQIKRLATRADSGNVYMIQVNHQIGYVTDYMTSIVGADAGTLYVTVM